MDIGDLQATYWPGGQLPSDGHMAWWSPDPLADPDDAIRELGLPAGQLADLPTVLPASPRARKKVMAADIPARVVPIQLAVRALAALPPAATWPGWHKPSDSVVAWSVAAKLALELTTAGQIVPMMRSGGPGAGVAYWHCLVAGDGGRLAALAETFLRPRTRCCATRTTRPFGPHSICCVRSATASPTPVFVPQPPPPHAAHRLGRRRLRPGAETRWLPGLRGGPRHSPDPIPSSS